MDTPTWIRRAACRALPTAWWYPTKTEAAAIPLAVGTCRTCPVRLECLLAALEANEENGIHGGAGEGRRRALRARAASGRFDEALAAHWRALDGVAAEAGDAELLHAFGEGATHGRQSTYAKGCRCEPCCAAIGRREVQASLRRRPKRPASRRDAA